MYSANREVDYSAPFESIHLLKAFTSLYKRTVLSDYLSATFLISQAKEFGKKVALRTFAGIAREPIQKFLDQNRDHIVFYEELRDKVVQDFAAQYKFIIKASQIDLLAGYIVSASMAMTYYMPSVDVGPICYAFGKFTGLNGVANSIYAFYDNIEDKEAKAYMISTIANVTRSVLSMALQAKLAAYFTAVISTTLVANPIAASVIATLLAATVTAVVINSILYTADVPFLGGVKNILYRSPAAELEALIKSHEKYLDTKKLTPRRENELQTELNNWREELKTFKQMEGLVAYSESALKELQKQGVKEDSVKMKQAKSALKHAKEGLDKHEKKYFYEKQKDALASRMIPDFLMNVISNTIPGFYFKMIFCTEIRSIFNTVLTIRPSELYKITNDQIMNSFYMAADMIPMIIGMFTGDVHMPVGVNIVETLLINTQIINAINNFLNNTVCNIVKTESVQTFASDRVTALQDYLQKNGGKTGENISFVITKISESVQEVLGLKVAEVSDSTVAER